MRKTYIHTCDVFNHGDEGARQRCFISCYKKALLNRGLINCVHYEDDRITLELWGTKYQFIKYYLLTLLKTEHKVDGVKRLISIVFT